MRIIKPTCSVALALAVAACGSGDSDNVMAAGANLLSPAQVDLALGPETANAPANGPDPANAVNAVDAVESDRVAPTRQTQTRPENRVAEPPEEEPANAAAAEDSSVEE